MEALDAAGAPAMIAGWYPTTTTPIWEARKWRKASAGTQNLCHCDKSGGATVAQARAC